MLASNLIDGLKRLPDLRAAIEALGLFLLVIGAGVWAVYSGVLVLKPIESSQELLLISVVAFVMPALGEELLFRGWVRRGAPIGAVLSLLMFILWHPVQYMAGSPFARPEFMDAGFLSLVSWLGLACTLSRIRSGSIWPGVVIHWGAAVIWKALFAG
ncbi:MAG: CPBP family glutamic-type intramembrane protease [Alphaproteobacteria bacterium]|nr:CPBP family glutamic-type intramembrane protease [Alphaproteobacteria bacterium]